MKDKTRRTGNRPTQAELNERVDFTIELMFNQRLRKGACKRALKERFGINARTCDEYFAKARDRHGAHPASIGFAVPLDR